MPVGIGGGGFIGYAVETVSGTYVAPTKYVPIMNESLVFTHEPDFRRPIRQSADVIGATAGFGHNEGEVSMEAFEDHVAMWLRAARYSIVKTGTTPNFTYTYTPTAVAQSPKTLSITTVRNGIVFGYTGCVVGGFTFAVEDAKLMFNATVLGNDEAVQSAPTPTWATGIQTEPYGAGKYNLQIPTTTQVFDMDAFEFTVENAPEANNRLKTSIGAEFIAFGERSVTLTTERDFLNRTDYDAFKALTATSITLLMTKGANNSIQITMPVSVADEYTVALTGQGDVIRASTSYQGVIDATGNSHTIVVKTQEDITPP